MTRILRSASFQGTAFTSVVVALVILAPWYRGLAHVKCVDPVVAGVHAVWCGSDPSSLFALSESAIPIVAGNELTSSCPSVVGIASVVDGGRAVAFGHEGFFQDGKIELFDNLLLATNAIQWLDILNRRKVMITANHGEWAGPNNLTILQGQIVQLGGTVIICDQLITAERLQGVGVVVIGNMCGTLTGEELAALEGFLHGGGGLFLLGLGWSWGGLPDDYPMNRIGELCGMRWARGAIVDPVNSYNGSALFTSFYPDPYVTEQTLPNALECITLVTSAHATDLPSALQSDSSLRARYSNAHALLGTALSVYPPGSPSRQLIYDFYTSFITANPQYFREGPAFNYQTESGIAWVRERVHRTLADALPLTPEVKAQIASTICLTGRERDLWDTYAFLLHDNASLDAPQEEFIYQFLGPIPADMHNLRSVVVPQFLGPNVPKIQLDGFGGNVTFNWDRIGVARYNSFPEDFPAPPTDWYCFVAVHYVNHIVDAYFIEGNETLRLRKNALIAAAGEFDALNYLWSRDGASYLYHNTQEYWARSANIWFEDSKRTLELGFARFATGRTAPLNQALFFIEVFSRGGDTIDFYTIDTLGVITRRPVPLNRDARGHVNGLTVDGVHYAFSLDEQGNVLDFALPVQMVDFRAASARSGGIRLTWRTLSETNSYGFEVQKSECLPDYHTVSGAFISGHGTTTEVHEYAWTDPNGGTETYYRLRQIDLDGIAYFSDGVQALKVTGVPQSGSPPTCYSLSQNFPNPFNPGTVIHYQLPMDAHVTLRVYDLLGREMSVLVDDRKESGYHAVNFDGSGLASGVYVYRLTVGDPAGNPRSGYIQTRKLMLLK